MRDLRLVLLGLAAAIAVLLGAGFLKRAVAPASRQVAVAPGTPQPISSRTGSGEATSPTAGLGEASRMRAEIERDIADAPDYVRFFDRLRLLFPSDYNSIMNGLAASSKPGEVNVDLVMADAVTALRRAHGGLATRAGDAALEQIFSLQLREMKALAQRDSHLCVAFLYGANGNGFLGFAADHRALVADAAIAGLDAMNSGRMDQIARNAPSDNDFQALDRALVDKGLTRPEIDALLDGKVAEPPIADPTMCQAGQTYLETLATLSPDSRARLYGLAVDLMAKS